MYMRGSWTLSIDGMIWYGKPGSWELRDDEDVEPCLSWEDPHWLLGILDGCVETSPVDSGEIDHEVWTRTRLRCEIQTRG
jgi:hypothetical protein